MGIGAAGVAHVLVLDVDVLLGLDDVVALGDVSTVLSRLELGVLFHLIGKAGGFAICLVDDCGDGGLGWLVLELAVLGADLVIHLPITPKHNMLHRARTHRQQVVHRVGRLRLSVQLRLVL